MTEKILITVVCLIGIAGVFYGLLKRDHVVFVAGLVFVIAGYVMFRKKLKSYLKEKYLSEHDPKRH